MIRLGEARRRVLEAMPALPETDVLLAEGRGLALARDVVAPHDVPPFANSAVDGFAVITADTAATPVTLEVLEDVPAGSVPTAAVVPGAAVKVMTGALIPDGADGIVMVEDTHQEGSRVTIAAAAAIGDHIRPAGGDFEAGAVVVSAGDRLDPARVGILASIGVTAVPVRRRPRVTVLSTGDEVVPADTAELRPGTIRNSNGPMLKALLEELGADVIDLGIVPDDERLMRSAFEEAAASADAVASTGGVSMGDYDLVKQLLGEMGEIEFWRVAMQPAKPFAFGFLGETPLFGLPGNPVSVLVAFEQFLRPALLHAMGSRRLLRPRGSGVLAEAVRTNPEKAVFLRVTITGDGGWKVSRAGAQGSNVLSAMAAADAFAMVPVGIGDLAEGDAVTLELFRSAESRSLEAAFDD